MEQLKVRVKAGEKKRVPNLVTRQLFSNKKHVSVVETPYIRRRINAGDLELEQPKKEGKK